MKFWANFKQPNSRYPCKHRKPYPKGQFWGSQRPMLSLTAMQSMMWISWDLWEKHDCAYAWSCILTMVHGNLYRKDRGHTAKGQEIGPSLLTCKIFHAVVVIRFDYLFRQCQIMVNDLLQLSVLETRGNSNSNTLVRCWHTLYVTPFDRARRARGRPCTLRVHERYTTCSKSDGVTISDDYLVVWSQWSWPKMARSRVYRVHETTLPLS